MNIDLAYALFAAVAALVFRLRRPAVAVAIVFFGGWVVLPVGHYSQGSSSAPFAFWIVGLALPSDMLLTKAWVAPVTALLGAAVFDSSTLRQGRPKWIDAPVIGWCMWPLAQATLSSMSTIGIDPLPAGWISSLYLAGCWGAPWMLGRVYFAGKDGQFLLVRSLAASALACLPFSLIEGVAGPNLYGRIYEQHPMRADGADRYVGHRPIGFFEHGNQFGIWICLCALATLWLAIAMRGGQGSRYWRAAAAVTCAMALASQSVGALLMFACGAAFLVGSRFIRPRIAALVLIGSLAVGGLTYVSGVVPVMQIGKGTAIGRHILDAFRSAGRGSFTWRIAQDQKLLYVKEHVVVGNATWDWWRPKGTRPWGLAMLMLGEFGLVGVTLGLGVLLAPVLRVAWHAPRASGWRPDGVTLMLATIVAMAVLDALLNSFFFFPAIVAAGTLARTNVEGVSP